MTAAIVPGNAVNVNVSGRTNGFSGAGSRVMMMPRGHPAGSGVAGRTALYGAHTPSGRQSRQDNQNHETHGPFPTHLPSIARGSHDAPHPTRARTRTAHRETRLSRSAFPMTDTELNVIAALAIIGLRSNPNQGYRIPAATGTPATL